MRRLAGLFALLVLTVAPTSAAAEPLGALTQRAGTTGCSSFGAVGDEGACADARALQGASGVIASPDGRFVYVSAARNAPSGFAHRAAIVAFAREPGTQELTQIPGRDGCVTQDGASEDGLGTCTSARALHAGQGADLAISADGRSLYATAQATGALLVFARDPQTGALSQLPGSDGCLSHDGRDHSGAPTCTDIAGFAPSPAGGGPGGPAGITLSPDDGFAYVTDIVAESITSFRRDPGTGALTQLEPQEQRGCMNAALNPAGSVDSCIGPDDDGGEPQFDALALMSDARRLAITPDGRYAYAASYEHSAILLFIRDTATGVLTPKRGKVGCISHDGSPVDPDPPFGTPIENRCIKSARGTTKPLDLVISSDGLTLYASGDDSAGGVAAYRIDPGAGSLAYINGAAGCITHTGADGRMSEGTDPQPTSTCANGRATSHTVGLALSPDGRTLYAVSSRWDSVAVIAVDPATGAMAQLAGKEGCVTATGLGAEGEGSVCTNGRALDGAMAAAVAPDGGGLFVTSFNQRAVSVLGRQAPPRCAPAAAQTGFEEAVALYFDCFDPDGDALTFSLVSPPPNGQTSPFDNVARAVAYAPRPGFAGTDVFQFRASDGSLDTGNVDATVAVAPPPQEPPPPPYVSGDTRKPVCTVLGLKSKLSVRTLRRERSLELRVRCDERATLKVSARADSALARTLGIGGRAGGLLGRVETVARPGVAVTLDVTLSKRVVSALRRVKGRALTKARLAISLDARDLAGNQALSNARLSLKR